MEFINQLWYDTQAGKPTASEEFINKLEMLLDRKLTAMPVGRPKLLTIARK